MKPHLVSPPLLRLCPLSAIILASPFAAAQTTYYLDPNGAAAGSGITAGGDYAAASAIWSTAADGSAAPVAHVNNNPYVISAGTDAAGLSYSLTGVLQQPSSLTIEEGFITINSTLDTLRNPTIRTENGTSLAIPNPNLRATATFNTLGSSSVNLFRLANNNGASTTFIKNGPGSLVINDPAANIRPSFVSTLNNGTVRIRNGNAFFLSDSRLTLITLTINSGGTLELDNNITVANNPVTIGGPGFNNGTIDLGAISNFSGNNNYNSRITLGSASRINNNAAGTTLALNPAGAVSLTGPHGLTLGGTGDITVAKSVEALSSLTKDGTGTLTLSGLNTFQGPTSVAGGTLVVAAASPFGPSPAAVTILPGAVVDLAGQTLGAGKTFTLAGGSLLNSTGTTALGNAAAATLLAGGSYAPGSFPNVTIGGPGSGAVIEPLLQLESMTVTGLAGGSGYSSTATATFTAAPSGGTTATARLSFGLTQASITSISGGTGWAVNDVISINGPTGSVPAQATVSSVNGTGGITGITLTTPGSGYTAAPTAITKVTSAAGVVTGVTLSANATNFTVSAVTITSLGGGYLTAPALNISAPNSGGTQASATAPNSTVHALAITNGGSGYTSAPAITFTGGIVDATATGGIASVALTDNGIIGGNGDLHVTPGISSTGSFGILKTGSGTTTLAGANSYTGDTTVANGTLGIEIPNFATTSTLTIGSVPASPAVLHLPNAGTHIVAALIIDGASMTPGTIYSQALGNADGAITGLGAIEVAATATGYGAWATAAGLQNPWLGSNPLLNGEPTADPDGDGIENVLEYAVAGLDPSLPNSTVGTLAGLTLTVAKREPLPADLTYIIETSTDLGDADNWSPAVTHSPPHTSNSISHTLTGTGTADFMRLKVVLVTP